MDDADALEEELLAMLESSDPEQDLDQAPSKRPRQAPPARQPWHSQGGRVGTQDSASIKESPGYTAQEAPAPALPSSTSVGLTELPAPLLLRVVSFLSPEDLGQTAQACRCLHAAANDAQLWKALCYARWPAGPTQAEEGGEDRLEPPSWKARYRLRDAAEVETQVQSAPEPFSELNNIYLQMAAAKRSEPLNRAQCAELFAAPDTGRSALSSRVAQFRSSLGLQGRGESVGEACADGGCSYIELEANYWICQLGGEVHECGEGCSERVIDGVSKLPVCRITGRCFGRLMSEFEEAAEDSVAAAAGAAEGEDWNADGEIGGRLGRAFYVGYNASQKEMLQKFGIKL